MLHAAFVRSPHAHARVRAIDASGLPEGCFALTAADVEDLGVYGCQVKDQRGPDRRRALRGRRRRRRRRPHARGGEGGGRRWSRSTGRSCPPSSTRWSPRRPAPRSCTSAAAVSARRRRLDRRAPDRGLERVPSLPDPPRRRRRGDGGGGRRRRGGLPDARARRTCRSSRTPRWPSGTATGWRCGPARRRRSTCAADLAGVFGIAEEAIRIVAPPMGGSFGAKTFVRLEAMVAALARRAGAPVKAVLDRAEEFVTLNRHPATMRVRIGARRDGTLVAKELDCWVDTGAYADCGPGVATKLGYAGVGSLPDPARPRRRARDLHQPAAQRRLPRLRGDAVRVGVGAHDGPAGRRAGHEPARAAPQEPPARRRPLRHGRGDA